MALKSELFSGDPKLEAAAVSDPAHILQGATGFHVGKIQQALLQLDGTFIAEGELQSLLYGPSTAAAVLAYKRKRNIVNRSYQTQADNIVGKMTIAALDKEMIAQQEDETSDEPVRIRALFPITRGVVTASNLAQSATFLLGFKIDLNIPNVSPNGVSQKIRLEPRKTGDLEVTGGNGGVVTCNNIHSGFGDIKEKICQIFDPADPNPQIRLVPEPQRPANDSITNGGVIKLVGKSRKISVDAFRPGDAFVHASDKNFKSVHSVAIEVRAPTVGPVPGSPLTKIAFNATSNSTGSKFFSGKDEPDVTGIHTGRPVNLKGGGRKINIGGEQETPGFEDYQTDLDFSGYQKPHTGNKAVFRPLTEDTDSSAFVKNNEASDICMRGTPIAPRNGQLTINAIKRIAAPGCRFFYSGDVRSVQALKKAFPLGAFVYLEESPNGEDIVIQFP